MKQSDAGNPGCEREAKLPRRDWFLLPFVSLLTICAIAVSAEFIARRTFYNTGGVARYCMTEDLSTGYRAIPNSVCTEKNADTPLVEYRFNNCGHRAGMECGPKPRGTYRIVLIGSSLTMGFNVAEEKTFAARLPAELSQLTGLKVEVYNEALPGKGGTPRNVLLRFNDVLAAQPDLILWGVTPWDIENDVAAESEPPRQQQQIPEAGFAARVRNRIQKTIAGGSISAEILVHWNNRPISSMTEHFVYESQSLLLKYYLPSQEAEFMKVDPSLEWIGKLSKFDIAASVIESRARDAHVTLAAIEIPYSAQTAMISTRDWPAAYDPYKFDDQLRSIIVSHGGTYIDILPDFRDIPNPERFYYPVDSHLNARGHKVIADMIAKALTSGAIPELKATASLQPAQKRDE